MKNDDDDIQEYISYRAAFPKEYDGKSLMRMQDRNETLEEVAKEIEKLPFGDTASSFAIFVRDMKR
jgi:hypothetical protein